MLQNLRTWLVLVALPTLLSYHLHAQEDDSARTHGLAGLTSCITQHELPAQILGSLGSVTTLSNDTMLSGKVVILGGLVIQEGVTLTLAPQSTLVFAPGHVSAQPANTNADLCRLRTHADEYSYLYLSAGSRLEATKAVLRAVQSSSCGVEWQGIIAENNSEINLLGAAPEDIIIANAAEYGIRLVDCGAPPDTIFGQLKMRYVSMRETMIAGPDLTPNPGSVKVYKFPSSTSGVNIENSLFEWGDGVVLPSILTGLTSIKRSRFQNNAIAISIIEGRLNQALVSTHRRIYIKANTFNNIREKCISVNTNLLHLDLRCNLFESNPAPNSTVYGIHVSSTGRIDQMGSISQNPESGPMGNAWPIYRSGPNAGDPIPGWVSFFNANPNSVIGYYRAENEDVGLDSIPDYQNFYVIRVTRVKYYSGDPALRPSDAIQVCDDSPLYGGGYFRVGVITGIDDDVQPVGIYPNPVQGEVRITGGEVKDLTLIAPDGRTVPISGTQEESTYRLDMSGLNPGLYIIKATVGGRYIYEKVVKL